MPKYTGYFNKKINLLYNFLNVLLVLVTKTRNSTYMKRLILIILIIGLAIGFPSCTEDEFLEPTTIDLQIKMVNTKPFDDLPEQANRQFLEFTEGKFYIKSIEFDGERENNDRHNFTRVFENTLSADLTNSSLNQNVSFDIPQGIYNHIEIKIKTHESDSLPGLQFRGKWREKTGRPGQPGAPHGEDEIPVELNFFKNYGESIDLTLNTEAGVGNEQIVFDGDNWNTMEVRINMAQLFRVNPGIFGRAKIQGEGKNKKIIISRYHNNEEDMYYSLVRRVEKSIKAVIK